MISKIDLRKELIEKRRGLNTKVLSDLICKKIAAQKEYIDAKTVYAYYPKPFEVDISSLFKDNTKKWFLPKTNGDNLKFYEYKSGDELVKGNFGVYEPNENILADVIPDLIIIPAISIDKNNYRLGYGKGYYDRFLDTFINPPKTLVPIFSDLIIDNLPTEPHDKKIDIVVTEKF